METGENQRVTLFQLDFSDYHIEEVVKGFSGQKVDRMKIEEFKKKETS